MIIASYLRGIGKGEREARKEKVGRAGGRLRVYRSTGTFAAVDGLHSRLCLLTLRKKSLLYAFKKRILVEL